MPQELIDWFKNIDDTIDGGTLLTLAGLALTIATFQMAALGSDREIQGKARTLPLPRLGRKQLLEWFDKYMSERELKTVDSASSAMLAAKLFFLSFLISTGAEPLSDMKFLEFYEGLSVKIEVTATCTPFLFAFRELLISVYTMAERADDEVADE